MPDFLQAWKTPPGAPAFATALIVEDEPSLASLLRLALKKLDIRSVSARTLEEARQRIEGEDSTFDLVLLDRGLPDGDGLELCDFLQQQGHRACVLMLTAQGDTNDRVQGLNAGADDYLAKPFSWEELEARIRALARRRAGSSKAGDVAGVSPNSPDGTAPGLSQDALSSSPPKLWAVDEGRLRILGERGWAELTPLEFKLAKKLIDSPGTIISRDDLLKEVWGFTLLPKTRTVDHFLGRLRKHLEENPEQPRHFTTVRGAGYLFEL